MYTLITNALLPFFAIFNYNRFWCCSRLERHQHTIIHLAPKQSTWVWVRKAPHHVANVKYIKHFFPFVLFLISFKQFLFRFSCFLLVSYELENSPFCLLACNMLRWHPRSDEYNTYIRTKYACWRLLDNRFIFCRMYVHWTSFIYNRIRITKVSYRNWQHVTYLPFLRFQTFELVELVCIFMRTSTSV